MAIYSHAFADLWEDANKLAVGFVDFVLQYQGCWTLAVTSWPSPDSHLHSEWPYHVRTTACTTVCVSARWPATGNAHTAPGARQPDTAARGQRQPSAPNNMNHTNNSTS